MSHSEVQEPATLSRRVMLLLAAIAATIGMVFAVAAGPVPSAQANDYCTNVWLKPLGSAGNSCQSSFWGHIILTGVANHERAGCANYNGYYGEYYRSWACYAAGVAGYIQVPPDGGSYHAIIRNNNGTYAAHFDGFYNCCYQY